jgi:6-phospho-beta-glucosidase
VDVTFECTTDRRRAFDGADFILTTFRPGTHEQQEQDESVPPKYGLQGNETVGIGGMFMACRVAPVLQAICDDAEAVCPDAWIVNYTNPTQYVADVVRRISKLKIISLCDGYVGVARDLAPLLQVDPSDITLYPAGSNHGMWIMRFTVKGEDGYPILRERLDRLSWDEIEALYPRPERVRFGGWEGPADQIYEQFIPQYSFPFSLKLYQVYGLLPAPRYYTRYHYDQDAVISEQRSGQYVTMAQFYMRHSVQHSFDGLDGRFAQALEKLADARLSERRKGGGSHGDLAVRIIASMVNDLGEIFDVNVPNNGAVSNLPEGAILELAATVDRLGPHPFAVGPMPKSLLGYQLALVLSQELCIDAALSGDRGDLLKAILAHPLIHSLPAAEAAMDELLSLQSAWLPQFH